MRLVLLLCAVSLALRAEVLPLLPAGSAYADASGAALKAPEGVACAGKGYVVGADTGNGRLVTWTFKDGALTGGAPIRFPELGAPARVQIDSKGNVFSLDQRTRRIVRVGEQGTFAGYVQPKGVPAASGFFPVAFKLDSADNFYLLDIASARLVVLDPAGAFVRQLLQPAGATLNDVAVDARGTVLAVDGAHAVVYAAKVGAESLTPLSKGLREYASFPSYLSINAQGLIVLVDNHGNGILVLGPDGTFLGRRLSIGWGEGLVYYPGQICIDLQGDIFVADRGNNRLQAFAPAK